MEKKQHKHNESCVTITTLPILTSLSAPNRTHYELYKIVSWVPNYHTTTITLPLSHYHQHNAMPVTFPHHPTTQTIYYSSTLL